MVIDIIYTNLDQFVRASIIANLIYTVTQKGNGQTISFCVPFLLNPY